MTEMQDSKFGEHLYLTPRVPQGLAAAVEGLTREVIRHRPDNIYAFAARHFENLLRMREEYDEPSTSEDKKKKASDKLLREVNEAVRQRYDDVDEGKDEARGWSLNETAKVLEKHRSIFGDSGQKVSTEQIRELANEPVLTSRQDGKKVTDPCTSRRRESPIRETLKMTPKMLSQIPIAKDIKTELRRNRICSRERKKVVACEYTRETTIIKKSSSFEKTKKSSYEMRKSSRTEDTKKRTETLTKSRSNSQEDRKFTRGGSMDSVKNYVMQNFVGMTSLDELQSPSYVEKVQEVIDETSSVIKEKVEALKNGVVRGAKVKLKVRKDGSSSSSEERSRRNSKEEQETTSLPAVRPPSSKSTSRSVSAKSGDSVTLPPISPEAAKSTKVKEDLVLPVLSPPKTNGSLEDDTTEAVDEIAEDVTVSLEKIEEKVVETVEERVENEVVVLDEKVDGKKTDSVFGEVVVSGSEVVEDVVVSEEVVHSGGEVVDDGVVSKEKVEHSGGEVVDDEVVKEEKKTESVVEENVPSGDVVVEDATVLEEKVDEIVEEIVPSDDKSVTPKDEQAVPSKESNDVKEDINEKLIESEKIHDEKIVSTEKNEETVIEISEETVTEKSEETVVDESEKTVTEVNEEIIIEKSDETVIDKNEEIVIEKIEEVTIDEKQMSSDLITTEKASSNFLQVKEEEFHDSLNVTPEPFDTKGQRPDSLENSLAEDTKSIASSGHVSPIETLKDKLLEIEEVQKRIEDVLDDTKTSENVVGKTDEAIAAKIEDKLIEIQESEKRIEQILDSQSTTTAETMNSDIKNKLQELEEVERRIENIFVKDAPTIDVGESVEDTSTVESEEKETTTEMTTNENLSVPTTSNESTARIETSRAVSPHSYILTEGSPYEIPDSVTTVIIPDRTPSPDSETLQVEVEDGEVLKALLTSRESESISIHESAFGESVEPTEPTEPSTVDVEYAKGIKASHDAIVSRESLDRIKEEVVDSEDEKVLKVVTSSLEEILEKEEVEYVEIAKYTEEKVETIENSLESTVRSVESTTTNEVKETSVTTDRSSLSLAPAVPFVPELNLDSLPDLSISSFNISSSSKKEDDSSLLLDVAETREFEKLEEAVSQLEPTTAAASVINNTICDEANEENKASQCTIDSSTTTTMDEKKSYHIYVPEAGSSKEPSSSSETSTSFMSAATKIQAGVRGFLTRRRLQSTQKRSSTLDSVPSIQESFAIETSVPLMPIVESTATSESKSRKKLRREDAVRRTTLSVENAFAENQIQHTGEFHDCIPLPVFDSTTLSMKTMKQREEEKAKEKTSQVEHLLEKILLGHAAANFGVHPKLVDVMLLPGDTELQSKYLNFITSVEDVFSDVPETPKGVIIEEITSLDETSKSVTTEEVKKVEDGEETVASISTSEDPLSINIEEVLGLGEEDEPSRKSNRLNVKLNAVDQIRSSSVSQDSPVSDERTRSPVTMMQIAPKSVDEKSTEDNPT